MKVRQNLYIDAELSSALDMLARGSRTKSRIVNDALKDYLARRASKEIDDLLKTRLDRMSREMARMARDVDILLESLSLFVRYQLTVTAPLPEGDSAALAIGRDRFEAFVGQVGRQIAAGKRTLGAAPEQSS
ncbi:MAG: CopG family transcriptional regulator [Sphingobium sp.]|nr:CopG family transcriptional regulator [Sphingobium sp.]MBP9157560.1 CopG family transcriptional regulator [Sphingobium sp.]